MSNHGIVVIGASAGGVETLMQLVGGLPDDLDAALFVVLHVSASAPSVLPHILSRQGSLPACHPVSLESIRPRQIYVAPPNHHLIIEEGRVVLSMGPKENGHRPAIDALFRSAALAYGPRVIGIVLSGAQSDGAAGLKTIKTYGGIAIVQDPEEALYPSMPRNAIHNAPIDHILKIAEMSRMLPSLVAAASTIRPPRNDEAIAKEVRVAEGDDTAMPDSDHPGDPSVYACPDCHGTLWEIREGDVLRFRCRVGHAWTAEDLLVRQQDAIEDAMWMAVRALEERASLARRLAARTQHRPQSFMHERFEDQAREALNQAAIIRRALEDSGRKLSEQSDIEAESEARTSN